MAIMAYPMQVLLAGFTLLIAFPLATSKTTATTSKEEIKCITCIIFPPPPPVPPVIECPPPPPIPPSPPPIPPSPPPIPPSPPPIPPSPPPIPPSPPPPPAPSPPPPVCNCRPCPTCIICIWCRCVLCPPPCPGCPPPPCNVCQVPPPPKPRPEPSDDQPGVISGAVYSPPNEVNPYFPYSSFRNPPPSDESTSSSINLELKHVVSIIILSLSATFSFF